MTEDHPAAYGDAFADVYDDWYDDTTEIPDIVRTVDALAKEGRVLELGAGTGRVALPLATAGMKVDAIDASLAMLRIGRTKGGWDQLNVVCGDMARLPVSGPYDVALIAFNTLSNLTTAEAQADAIAEVSRVLTSGGALVVDLFVPVADIDRVGSGSTVRDDGDGGTIVTSTTVRSDVQLIDGQHRHRPASGSESTRKWAIRYLYPHQLDAMCADCGLQLESRYSNWSGGSLEANGRRHVSVFRKKP